jgi:hypothetical protein
LCRRHHRFVHEHGFTIAKRGDEVVFLDPAGRPIQALAPATRVSDGWMDRLRGFLGEVGVSAASNLPGWDGAAIDYDRCVGALC